MIAQQLTDEDRELIELARRTVDENTDLLPGAYRWSPTI